MLVELRSTGVDPGISERGGGGALYTLITFDAIGSDGERRSRELLWKSGLVPSRRVFLISLSKTDAISNVPDTRL